MNKKNVISASNSAAISISITAIGLLALSVIIFSANSFASPVNDNSQLADKALSNHVKFRKQQTESSTIALVNRLSQYRHATLSNKELLKQALIENALLRQHLQFELVKSDPEAAVRTILPRGLIKDMPDEVLPLLAHQRVLEGRLEVSYVDYQSHQHKNISYMLVNGDQTVELHLPSNINRSLLKTGAQVSVTGWMFKAINAAEINLSALVVNDELNSLVLLGDSAPAVATSVEPSGNAAGISSHGEQRTLVLLVNFQNNAEQPWTVEEARQLVFGNVNAYYQEVSYGQTWLTGDVHGYFTLPIDATCSTNLIDNHGRQAVIDSGIHVDNYDRWIYIYPQNSGCGWTGQGTIGGSPSRAFINGSMTLRTVGHELGHNFGLYHAKDLDCGADIIGDNCASAEYGDSMDMMGSSGITGHFNAFSKQQLGWITASAGEVVTADTDGSYQLEPFEIAPAGIAKSIKVQRGVDITNGEPQWYVLEYRQALGFDKFLEQKNGVTDGVVLHLATQNNINSNLLLDMQPDSGLRDLDDAALLVGASYTDPDAGVTITTEWADATGASVSVSYTGSSCIKASPSLTLLANESAWVAPGTTVSYSASVSNNDSAGCEISSYNISALVPSGWSVATKSVSLSPGMSGTVSLDVVSLETAEQGFYDIEISAVDSSNHAYSTKGIVSYVVETPPTSCVMANPSFILSIDDSGELAAGAMATYSGTITNHDSDSCDSTDFDVTANVPVGWRADKLVVSLAAGESRNVSFIVESSTAAQEGTYNVELSAINRLDSRYIGKDTASYMVISPQISCVLAAPSIVIADPLTVDVIAGTQVSYSATVTSLDSESCFEASFNVFADIPSGWSTSQTQVQLAPGGSAVVNINIASAPASPAGLFNLTVNAQNTTEIGYLGIDSVSYIVKAAPNTAPIAVNDSVNMSSKTSVLIDVLLNDYDADNDELAIVSVSQASKGSVQITSAGKLLYTPAKSFKSRDSFYYTISDGDMETTASVSLSLSSSSGGGHKGKGNGKG